MKFFKRLWMGIEAEKDADRRNSPRREMTVVCATSFKLGQLDKRALLLDLSDSGARFGTALDARNIVLDEGQLVDFHVSTPYGAATWTGRVVWTRLADTIYTWGVQFTEVLNPDKAPLERLLYSRN